MASVSQAEKRFHQLMRRSGWLYALLAVPTLLLLLHFGYSDREISRHIEGAWQAGFWRLPGLSATDSRIVADILTLAVIGALGWQFWQGLQQLRHFKNLATGGSHLLFHEILRWSLLFGLVLLAVIPFHSNDLYGYINRGVQQVYLHNNPYLTPIAEVFGWQNHPMVHDHWVYNPCPYGFFFAGLTKVVTGLSFRSFTLAFLLFKGLNLLALLGTTWLTYRLALLLKLKRPWLPPYLVGCNPLILLHAVGNGHNDILLVFLLLLSLWCLLAERYRLAALPVLALSVLVKYASLLAAPLMALYMLKHRQWRALMGGLLLASALVTLLAVPYIDPRQPWPWVAMLENAGKPQHSLVDMLGDLIYYPAKWLRLEARAIRDAAYPVLKVLFWGIFAALYAGLCGLFWRQPAGPAQLIRAVGLAMAVMIAFISSKFHPWYPLMFLPLLFLQEEGTRLRRFALLFSLFQLAGFSVFQNLPVFSVLTLTVLPLALAIRPPGRLRQRLD